MAHQLDIELQLRKYAAKQMNAENEGAGFGPDDIGEVYVYPEGGDIWMAASTDNSDQAHVDYFGDSMDTRRLVKLIREILEA